MVRAERIQLPHAVSSRDDTRMSLHCLLAGPDPRTNLDAPLVVLVHGFPELAYSWRHQFAPLAQRGFAVVAPDMRGYGESTVPRDAADIQAFAFRNVCTDLCALLTIMKRTKAVFVGHDFGGSIVWAMANHYPDACLGVAGINTPLVDPPQDQAVLEAGGPHTLLEKLPYEATGHLDYVAYFRTHVGVADEEMQRDVRRTMLAYFRSQISGDPKKDLENMRIGMGTSRCRRPKSDADSSPRGILYFVPKNPPRDPLWSEEEVAVYVKNFQKTGFPLGYYRAMDENWKWDCEVWNRNNGSMPKITFPCLMITATRDAVLAPHLSAAMEKRIVTLDRANLDCGHWSMAERPKEVNDVLGNWLSKRFGVGGGDAKL